MDIGKVREKGIKWIGKYKYLVLVVLLGVVLMLIPGKTEEKTSTQDNSVVTNTVTLDKELEKILSNIQGAGKVQVMLTVKSGEQIIYQTDVPGADREDTVIKIGRAHV